MNLTIALALYGVITLAVIYIDIINTYLTKGFGYGFSSNRPVEQKAGWSLRVERVTRNQGESAAYIVPALVLGIFLDLQGSWAASAAYLIVLGRLGFIITYYAGIPFIRALFFAASFIGAAILLVLALS